MMICAAVLETVGIGLIIQFISIVTNPNLSQNQAVLAYLYERFSFQSSNTFIVFLVIILLLVFVLKNLYLLFFFYAQNRVILNQQVKLSSMMLREYLTK